MNTHDAWEKIHREKDWGSYPSEHIIRFVARNYYSLDRSKVKILDFGCGAGAHTWYLAREGFDTYAFDISETAVSKVKAKLDKENLYAHVECFDGASLGYSDDFFDAVIDNVSIQSNKTCEIKRMYSQVYQKIKRGGRFASVVFDKETTGYGTGKELEPGTYEGLTCGCLQGFGHRHFFDEQELKNFMLGAGFSNVTIEKNWYTDRDNTVSQLIAVGEKV